jgi:two-component system, OmpR family, sensor kinase
VAATKVRTRLVLAFAYILLVLIVAVGVPLSINLEHRVTAELERSAFLQAQLVAGAIAPDALEPNAGSPKIEAARRLVAATVEGAAPGVRIVVVDRAGTVIVDAPDGEDLGHDYTNGRRPEIGSALSGKPASFPRYSDTEGREILATAVSVYNEDRTGIVGAVRVTQDASPIATNVRRVRVGLVTIGIAGLFAGLLIAFALARSLSLPLTRLAGAAKQLGEGDLAARAEDVTGPSEIEDLAKSFDEMAGRLERTVQAQRSFVANASHQLRTPLTGMKLRLESAAADERDPKVREQLEAAEREVDRLSEIVDRLLRVSREIEEGNPTQVGLRDAVDRALSRWSERARRLDSTLLASGDDITADGNPTDVDQILDNLIDNAITYAPGEIRVESGRIDGRAFVAVQDRGPGIALEDLERVTERFYRGRGAEPGGSGLGLAIARELAEKWGGTVDLSSEPGSGTRVEVRLRPAPDA